MTSPARSPLAPERIAEGAPVPGVRLATAAAGIKYAGRTDVMLMAFDPPATVAGVFTRSACPSAPVEWCRDRLAGGRASAVLVNSGNANAFTGMKGRAATERSADAVAAALGCPPEAVFLASTGVIGEPLDASKFDGVMADCAAALAPDGWNAAARAIMTTDTYEKVASRTADLAGVPVTITGIAKGAGMIAPDMATMLAFLATDAAVEAPLLQMLLAEGTAESFNRITVDGDTSTSDTVLAFATGLAGNPPLSDAADPRLAPFREALFALLLDLAHQVVRDGEGARKFVAVRVEGAVSDLSAERIARSIADSPLVKTAIAGEDANWGRVVMAVGKAGEPADRDRLEIRFGTVRVAVDGERDPAYVEAEAAAVMRAPEIDITVDLKLGTGSAVVWTCDLTKAYVEINGDYRS